MLMRSSTVKVMKAAPAVNVDVDVCCVGSIVMLIIMPVLKRTSWCCMNDGRGRGRGEVLKWDKKRR